MYQFVDGLVEAVVLREDEENYEEHVDMMGTGTEMTGVMERVQERNHLWGGREGERERGREGEERRRIYRFRRKKRE